MDKDIIISMVRRALREDKASNDITSNLLIDKSSRCWGRIIAKQDGIVAGLEFAKAAFEEFDSNVNVRLCKTDGEPVKSGQNLIELKGPTRSILTSERTALNFIGRLSGIATTTRQYVDAIKGLKTKILDTRKTTPTLRIIEKYGVECGGGENHRFDLSELVLIKDNHRSVYKEFISLADAVKKYRQKTRKPIQVEVDTLVELKDALDGRPDFILLDNMTLAQLRTAVEMTQHLPRQERPLLEASGGVTLKNVRNIAETGVDRISIGALTHSFKNFDASLEITPDE